MTDDLRPVGAPTLEDVARAAGVSRATVSRVVNGVRNVDPVIQEAVRRAVDLTGYAPNRAARSLVTRRTDAIALVVSGAGVEPEPADPLGATGAEAADPDNGSSFTAQVFADPFFGRVVTGVVNHLRPRGMHPVLMFAETSRAREEVVSFLRQGSADGALIVSTHAEDPCPVCSRMPACPPCCTPGPPGRCRSAMWTSHTATGHGWPPNTCWHEAAAASRPSPDR